MALTDLRIVARSMASRAFSTATTAATLAVAVALVLVLLSMQGAAFRAFERGSGNMHLLVSRDADPLTALLNGVFYANAPRRAMDPATVARVVDQNPLEWAVPTQQGDSYRGLPVTATTREFFTRFSPEPTGDRPGWRVAEGRLFDGPFEVVLGSRAAAATSLRPGDRIHLTHGTADARDAHVHTEFTYTVVGVLAPTGSSHDRALFTDLTSAWIVHAHDRRKRENPAAGPTTDADLTDADRLITGLYLRVATRPGSNVSTGIQTVFARLRADPSITVASPSDQIRRLFDIVGSVNLILLAMAGVVMLSSAVSIMLALYNSMEQRRRQIAVLRVLGATAGRILGLVLAESALIGLAGSAAGVVLAVVGARVVAAAMRSQLGLAIDPNIATPWIAPVVAGTVAISAAAGLLPAVMAYRTSVARSLRPLG